MSLPLLLLTLALAVNAQPGSDKKLNEKFRWKQLEFQFPNSSIRDHLLNTKKYIPGNNNPLGVDVWRNKLFVTVPRWFNGTASTLNYVDLNSRLRSPLLIPYPDYDMNDIHNGDLDNKIISTNEIVVDSCNRLWVADNSEEGVYVRKVLATRKLLIFNLNNNRLLRKVMMSEEIAQDRSWFHETIVDITNGDCNKAFAYIADALGYGLLVYSWETNTLRRISNAYFYLEPQNSLIGRAQIIDGVMGLALSGVNPDGYRTLYFHALASYSEYNVSTRVLQDPKLSSDFTNYKLFGTRDGKGKSSTQGFDEKTGVLFYTQVEKNGIGCWNSRRSRNRYSPWTQDMAVVDEKRITFPGSLTLDSKRNIWVVSNNYISFATRTQNPEAYNYRILYAPVDRLLEGTICKGIN